MSLFPTIFLSYSICRERGRDRFLFFFTMETDCQIKVTTRVLELNKIAIHRKLESEEVGRVMINEMNK